MRVVRHLMPRRELRPRVVLTLGNFDGVHRGHRAILDETVAVARARGAAAAVLTFEPHPVTVLAPERAPARLHTLHDRLACLRDAGIDLAVVQRFTLEFSRRTADVFVEEVLLAHFDLAHVVVGHRVSFGRGRSGDASTLRRLGARLGFGVDEIGPVTVEGEQVSSTAVRDAVARGDMRRAAALLGRPWGLRARVVRGDGRGRTLGFPTANLHLRASLVTPPDGVYAARATIDGATHDAVVNVGLRPTFAGRTRAVEVHVLGVDASLYGAWLIVDFVHRLRGEQRFPGPDALRAAIADDVANARAILAAECATR